MDSSQTYWQGKARLVAWRWNFAAWLNLFLRFALAACFVMMCALLVIRRAEGSPMMAWWIFCGVVLLGALVCFLFARKKFCSAREALVRLDASLRLHNRLTSAVDGVGGWPQLSEDPTPDGLRWRWERIAVPPLACMAALLFAAFVPIPPAMDSDLHHKEEPLAWTKIQSQLEKLKKQDIVNQEAIVTLESQVDELRKQPPEDWYSHSSLEAGDNLQAKTNESIRSLQRDMQSALDTLEKADENSGLLTNDELQKLDSQFQQPLQGLELGTLPLNKEMLSELKDIDASQLRNLSKDDLEKLEKSLKEGIGGCKAAYDPDGDKDADMIGLLESGTEEKPGAPGGKWGGGPAELGLKPDPTNLNTKNNTQVTNDDLSHAAAGDMLGVSKGQHQVDPAKYSGPASAGTIQSVGGGGEAVWKNDLTPQEREILQQFYK